MTRCERHYGQCAGYDSDDPLRCSYCHRDWLAVTEKDHETRAAHERAHQQLDAARAKATRQRAAARSEP
jgi:hypothetical protein